MWANMETCPRYGVKWKKTTDSINAKKKYTYKLYNL